jgi:hypothetical protein
VRAIAQLELGQDPGDVRLGCRLADHQAAGDLGVGQPADHQDEHLTFPVGEPIQVS